MITGIIQFFYPDIQKSDIRKVSLLGLTFFFIVGSYWLLRLLKDLFFYDRLGFPIDLGYLPNHGRDLLPFAKMVSPWIVLCAVIIYTKLVDMYEKHKLFYIIATFYTIAFSIIASVVFVQAKFGNAFVGATILKITAYSAYWLTESLGSVLVALFWSFTVSSTTSDQARRTFPFIVMLGQLGSILGSSLLGIGFPVWMLFVIAITAFLGVLGTIHYLLKTVPADQMKSDKEEKKQKPDFFGGVKLLLTKPYLIGVLVVSTFYEIAGTIVDYQMKSQVMEAGIHFGWFQSVYGMSVNILSFTLALLGTSALMKKFGIRICLLVYPLSFAIMLTGLYIVYQSGLATPAQLAWAAFAVMIVVKGASYAVNNPIKEMMYIPTSKDAKFKAKGIIDMLGGRSAKAGGAKISDMLKGSMDNLFLYGSLIGLGVIGLWIIAALYVGKKNKQLVDTGKIIE
ncbi:hypothetical protein HYV11_03030 [Candidatus Dependentiae bacterium]|nr:hypothetical protein [Candidatus Dependentiae bacterium]